MAAQPLVPVFAGTINNESALLCDARLLHGFLRVGRRFASWITERIAEYGFEENQDFVAISQKREIGHGRGRTDYHLTIDTAKELAMVERNEQGRAVRRYFIECEKRLRQIVKPATTTDARSPLRAAVSMLVGKRSLMYPDAYALVHQRFGVEHIDQLAPEQIGQAVEYVHRLVLEGEVLPAERAKGAAVLLDDTEAFNLAGLLRMLPYFEDVQQKAEEILRAAESPLAAGIFDAWHETALFCGVLESVRDRCNEVKERLSKPLLK